MTEGQSIVRDVIERLVAHARRDAPLECCGLLVSDAALQVIDECVPTRNVRESPTEYLIDPAEHFALLRRVRAEGRRVAGAYHSHLGTPAEPSERDMAQAHDAELLHVIVSLANATPSIRAFRLRRHGYTAVQLHII